MMPFQPLRSAVVAMGPPKTAPELDWSPPASMTSILLFPGLLIICPTYDGELYAWTVSTWPEKHPSPP